MKRKEYERRRVENKTEMVKLIDKMYDLVTGHDKDRDRHSEESDLLETQVTLKCI